MALDVLREACMRRQLDSVEETEGFLVFPRLNRRLPLDSPTGLADLPTLVDVWRVLKQFSGLAQPAVESLGPIHDLLFGPSWPGDSSGLPPASVEALDESKPEEPLLFPLAQASYAEHVMKPVFTGVCRGPGPVISGRSRPRLSAEPECAAPLTVHGDEGFDQTLTHMWSVLDAYSQKLDNEMTKRRLAGARSRDSRRRQSSLYTWLAESRRTPIVVIPSAQSSSLINQSNIRQFVFERKYSPAVNATVDHKFTWTVDLKSAGLGDILRDAGGKYVDILDLKICDMTMTSKFTRWDWYSVVAVVCTDQAWQFKRWPFRSVDDLFNTVKGYVCSFSTDDIPPVSRNVDALLFDKCARHLDGVVWIDFVKSLLVHLDEPRDIARHYSQMDKGLLPEKKDSRR